MVKIWNYEKNIKIINRRKDQREKKSEKKNVIQNSFLHQMCVICIVNVINLLCKVLKCKRREIEEKLTHQRRCVTEAEIFSAIPISPTTARSLSPPPSRHNLSQMQCIFASTFLNTGVNSSRKCDSKIINVIATSLLRHPHVIETS